jgi:hypothetical protein
MKFFGLPRYFGARTRRPARRVTQLELHVTHVCNLTCESCSHYSNHGHGGHLNLSDADKWMGNWSHRFQIDEFHLLGGEPTIHPDLTEFVPLVRRHWPKTFIRIRTNGFFLHRHPNLPARLEADGRAEIIVSLHHDSPEYRAHLLPMFELVERWRNEFGVNVIIAPSFENWTRRYHGFGDTMQPFEDGSQRASWEICPARQCKQLFEGKIWKCAPLAYLKLQKTKYKLASKWDFYLGYEPLGPECTDQELDQFIAREDEPFCGMCSAHRRPISLPLPIRRKEVRQIDSIAIVKSD